MLSCGHYSQKEIDEQVELLGGNDIFVEAWDGDSLVGFGCADMSDVDVCWLTWVGVLEGYRGRGYAGGMVKLMEEVAKEQGAHKIWSCTHVKNGGSIGLFVKHNYTMCGHLKKHWYGYDVYLWDKVL